MADSGIKIRISIQKTGLEIFFERTDAISDFA